MITGAIEKSNGEYILIGCDPLSDLISLYRARLKHLDPPADFDEYRNANDLEANCVVASWDFIRSRDGEALSIDLPLSSFADFENAIDNLEQATAMNHSEVVQITEDYEIRAALMEYKGHPYIDIRSFTRRANGKMSKKVGITFPPQKLSEFADLIRHVGIADSLLVEE